MSVETSSVPFNALSSLTQDSLRTMFSVLKPLQARALQLAVIPYWFDLALMVTLRGSDDADGRTPKLVDWLSKLYCVSRLPGDRYIVSREIRGSIRVRWLGDRPGFAAANGRLAKYFAERRLAEGIGPDADELTQAYIYHMLCVNGDVGVDELEKAVAAAELYARMAVVERLLMVVAEQCPFLEVRHVARITYLEARSLQLHGHWAESCTQFKKLLENTDLPADLRPRVQAALAAGLDKMGRRAEALELYRQSLGLAEDASLEAAPTSTGHAQVIAESAPREKITQTADLAQYDVFISYSRRDENWVQNWLLPQLEAAHIRVIIDFRDFEPGAPSLTEMERAVSQSRKTLIVLTPDYVSSEWTEFENILAQTLDPAAKHRRLVPLLHKTCDIPLRIRTLTYLDFTKPGRQDLELSRLVTAIKSGAGQVLDEPSTPAGTAPVPDQTSDIDQDPLEQHKPAQQPAAGN